MWSLTWYDDDLHSMPMGDTGQHWTDRYCLCLPECIVNEHGVSHIVHNAWDGREKHELASVGLTFEDRASETLDVFRAMR